MTEPVDEADFFNDLRQELRHLAQGATDGLNYAGAALRNRLRQLRSAQLDYVVIRVGGTLPERTGPPRSFIQRQLPLPPEPLTLEALNYQFRIVADADNVKGVVLNFQGFATGLATLQSLSRSIQRLQSAGKKVVAYTPYLDVPNYLVAAAADTIVAPPGARFEVLGLRSETAFLKDALELIGVQADVVQISPYKTAANSLSQSDWTPEHRAQVEWLLDDNFDQIVSAIAAGRNLSPERVRELIDEAPFSIEQAQAHCLVDHVAYDDELACLLADQPDPDPLPLPGDDSKPVDQSPPAAKEPHVNRPQARLMTFHRAYDLLTEKPRRRADRRIGVVSLEGAITMGPSHQPPIDLPIPLLGSLSAGEATIVQLLRQAEQDDTIAAVVFHVESPGGSALASDLIWRQVRRLREKKPVVVYMGNIAASGGYYVGAAAQRIVAQSGAITGSIGVLSARISTAMLYQKVKVNRVSLSRGRRANLYADSSPLNPDERAIFWDNILDIYQQFKTIVAEGRGLPLEKLDEIGGGRVWTGRQALEHGLVDSHGDMLDALHEAAGLAGLPLDEEHYVPTVNLHPKERDYLLPSPFEAAEELAALLFGERLRGLLERPLLLLPFTIRLW